MIGWKCKYGYLKNPSETPSTLDDIVFTDNSVITLNVLSNSNIRYSVSTVNYNEIAAQLIEAYGDDYYTLYAIPNLINWTTSQQTTSVPLAESILPSMELACPNLYKYYDSIVTNGVSGELFDNPHLSSVIYIESLNRVVVFRQNTPEVSPRGLLFSLSNNNLVLIYSADRAFNPFLVGYRQDYISGSTQQIRINITGYSLLNYSDGLNLSDPQNYHKIYLDVEMGRRASATLYTYDTDTSQQTKLFLQNMFTAASKPDFEGELPPPPDPMEPIGPSGPGGGNGNFDNDSDIIGDSSLPTISAADTGFTRIYSPTLSQVQDLAQYLWTDETVVETIWNKIKQLLENPMDAIISFSLVPVPVQISGTKNFALAYIDTGVSMNTVANQFVDVDCGTFELKEYYGSALDYSPNTKVSCFLPFIGVVTLNTDEVMNTTLTVRYRVDIVSGSCVAKIFVNESCLYQFSGHCSIPIPISAADFSSYLSAAIGVAKLAIGAAVGGGAGAAAAGASEVDVEQATRGVEISEGMSREQEMAAYQNAFDTYRENNQSAVTTASFRGISAQNVTNVVGTVMGSKLHVEHSGSFSGNTGYLGIRRPYLIIQRPRMCMPNEYRSFNGYPSMITLNIGDCKGYTKVQQVQLKNIPATNPEQSEIMQLLKGGIII